MFYERDGGGGAAAQRDQEPRCTGGYWARLRSLVSRGKERAVWSARKRVFGAEGAVPWPTSIWSGFWLISRVKAGIAGSGGARSGTTGRALGEEMPGE